MQVNYSSKLTNNGKLTSNKHKKYFKNVLYLYYSIRDYKLDFCPKKQTAVTPKGYSDLVAIDTSTAASEKLSGK